MTAIVVGPARTLAPMTREQPDRVRIPREYVKNAARVLKGILDELDTDERTAADKIGISQAALNALKNYERHPHKGVGIDVVYALAEYRGTSIDAVLGRAVPVSAADELRAVKSQLDELKQMLQPAAVPKRAR